MPNPNLKAGPGRPKGSQNKVTRDLKEAILEAATRVGNERDPGQGLVGYLTHLAKTNEAAFTPLIGKVLPMQVSGEGGGPVVIITGVKRAGDVDGG